MAGRTQERLADLARDNRGWVALGQVTAVEAHDAWGHLLTVALRPSGRVCQARPVSAGAGDARGDFWPVAVDDEVLVLFPEGDPNRAVALVGLTSKAAGIPSSWDNAQPQLVHPNGKHFRTAEGATVQPVVVEALLPDLSAAETEKLAIFGALAALGITLPSTSTSQLITNLATAYRSAAIKTE